MECGSPAVAARRLQINAASLPTAPWWVQAALAPETAAVLLDTAGRAAETNQCGGVYNCGEARLMLAILR